MKLSPQEQKALLQALKGTLAVAFNDFGDRATAVDSLVRKGLVKKKKLGETPSLFHDLYGLTAKGRKVAMEL